MSAPESILDLVRKVAELAKRGVDGEREAAQRKLDELLAKHKLTLADLSPESRVEIKFKVANSEERSLLVQIYCRVTNRRSMSYARTKNGRAIFLELNRAEADDVSRMFAHYLPIYRRERKKMVDAFGNAFFGKYSLFSEASAGDEGREISMDEALRIAMLRKGITGEAYHKPAKLLT